MIVDEHIWLYFNYVSLAATGVCSHVASRAEQSNPMKISDTPNHFIY